MKRRRFLKSIAAAPILATPAFPGALPQPASAAGNPEPLPVQENSKLEFTVADAVAEMSPRFFDAQQFAALRKLSDVLMPAMNGAPGALEARVPEFLDFLIGASPAERQQVYRAGLDALNAAAKKRNGKTFAEVDASQASALLEPLRQPWTYETPSDPLLRFLRVAKEDVRTATLNSREWNDASSSGGRRGGGIGQYWYPID